MKRPCRSEPSPALISMCAPTEEQKIVYTREMQLQAMIESGYDEEEAVMECGQKKRRLEINQVKALEKSFDVDNKLEPERKLKLAKDLNLQPRQVAVWFQNRRARWKTKQLERDYSILKASYESLQRDIKSLKTDHKSLIIQVKKLRSKLKEMKPDALNDDLGFEFDGLEPEIEVAPEAPPPMEELNALNKSSQSTDCNNPALSESDSSAILNSEETPKAAAAAVVEAMASAPIMIPQSHEYGNGGGFDFLCLSDTVYNNHMFQVKMEEQNFLADEEEAPCTFFSEVEQTPMLHWFTSNDNWQIE